MMQLAKQTSIKSKTTEETAKKSPKKGVKTKPRRESDSDDDNVMIRAVHRPGYKRRKVDRPLSRLSVPRLTLSPIQCTASI